MDMCDSFYVAEYDTEELMSLVTREDLSLRSNYEPFPSAMHALLFMLVHSPRPIVRLILGNNFLLYYYRVKLTSNSFFICAEK